jgi:hypothetical protein
MQWRNWSRYGGREAVSIVFGKRLMAWRAEVAVADARPTVACTLTSNRLHHWTVITLTHAAES